MRIMVKTKNGWKPAAHKRYEAEVKLQDLLHENPNLIPFDDLGVSDQVPRIAVKELGLPGSGNTDLVVIDGDGGITIIECKLADNPEAKRAVVGQLLEYAAHLWRMPVERFEDLVRARKNGSPADLLGLAGESREAFRRTLHETLETGTFTLLIATDTLDDQVRRIIEYVSAIASSNLQLFALEAAYFEDHGVQVVVPHVHGPVHRGPLLPRPPWTKEKFFTALKASTSGEVVAASEKLLSLSEQVGGGPQWGRGKVLGSFTCRVILSDGRDLSVFGVETTGRLWLSLDSYLTTRNLTPEMIGRYRGKLAEIPAFSALPTDQSWKAFWMKDALPTPEEQEKFSEAVRELITQWRGRVTG